MVARLARRAGVGLAGLCALVLLVAGPAAASFAVTRVVATTGVATMTVQPPTGVVAVLNQCSQGRWMAVTVSWTASTSPRLAGYTVIAGRADGSSVTIATTDASTTSVPAQVDKLSSGAETVTFTVIARVGSTWTATSQTSGPITC